MIRDLQSLSRDTFDLLVIGGGIFGAGVARDAALRGLSVALVDKADFASGTSSKSSKLIHGGFRYLEQYDFRLVAESCRERNLLRRLAPHRVKPLPLLLPVYRGDQRPLWKLRLGMTLYDLLAGYQNVASHRAYWPGDVAKAEPALNREAMVGAIRYFDCQEDDARFCIDNLLHAASLGGRCANYCQVVGFDQSAGTIHGAKVRDMLTGSEFSIRAKVIINASGPWAAAVAGLLPESAPSSVRLSPTLGVHILVPRLTREHGVFFQGRLDGRMMFILPWHDATLIGATDTHFADDPDAARARPADIEYLLAQARPLFPEASLGADDVIADFAGVRPLLHSDDSSPSSRSREHRIVRQGPNFISLIGGKYTTYRLIAAQAVDAAYKALGHRPPPTKTATAPIPNPRPDPTGAKLCNNPDVYESDIIHAIQHEMAQTADDIVSRRVGLTLSACRQPATEAVERILAVHRSRHKVD